MDTVLSTMCPTYIERLQQAIRVMEGLSDTERANFDIRVIAVRRESGISFCIAGLCGMDPWFQAQGFTTTVGEARPGSIGLVSLDLFEFFGTGLPFFRSHYEREWDVTVDDAIGALKTAIASFDDGSVWTTSPSRRVQCESCVNLSIEVSTHAAVQRY